MVIAYKIIEQGVEIRQETQCTYKDDGFAAHGGDQRITALVALVRPSTLLAVDAEARTGNNIGTVDHAGITD